MTAINIDMEHCLNCESELKIFGAVLEAPVAQHIFEYLGLQARAPSRPPAHAPMPTAG